ncbi:MAG: hypothetical protein U1F61_26985 [Opitutaceae bacterium]
MPSSSSQASPLLVWWIIWFAISAGLVAISVTIEVRPAPPGNDALKYLPLAPLMAATLVRWLVLPRFTRRARAFPLFVVGVALAEGSGLLGLFLVPESRNEYLLLSLLGLAQFVPVFATRYEA